MNLKNLIPNILGPDRAGKRGVFAALAACAVAALLAPGTALNIAAHLFSPSASAEPVAPTAGGSAI